MNDLTAKNRYYVYHLIDPRNDEVFYVGKGTGNRIKSHVREAKGRKFQNARKCERIIAIMDSGLKVDERIVFKELTEPAAYMIEAAEIDRIGRDCLTNLSHGLEPALVKDKKRAEQFIRDTQWRLVNMAECHAEAINGLISEMKENLVEINKLLGDDGHVSA